MLSPTRAFLIATLIMTGFLGMQATYASAAPAGNAITHSSDGPMGGSGGGCSMSCGGNPGGGTTTGGATGGCLNVTTFPSIIPQVSPGCGSSTPSNNGCLNVTTYPNIIPQVAPTGCGGGSSSSSSNPSCAYFTYTCNISTASTGAYPVTNSTTNSSTNTSNSTSSNSTSGGCTVPGQVPGNTIGIATNECVTPPSNNQQQLQPQPQPQQPVATPIPTPVTRTSCTDGTTTGAPQCPTTCTDGTTTANNSCPTTCTDGTTTAKTACPTSCTDGTTTAKSACPTTCSDGTTTANPSCSSCTYGNSATQAGCKSCPGGVQGNYSGGDPLQAGCLPPQTSTPPPDTSASTSTPSNACDVGVRRALDSSIHVSACGDTSTSSTSASAPQSACGSSLPLLPSMDLRVGDGPFVCVDCFVPGAPAATLMSSGDCTLAGGDWHPTASTGLPTDLNTGANSPYSTCVGLSNIGGIVAGPAIGSLSGGSEFCANLAKTVPPNADANSYMACVTAALFPQATRAGNLASSSAQGYNNSNINPDDAKQICANLVPTVSGSASTGSSGGAGGNQTQQTTGSTSSTSATSAGVSQDFENQCIAVFGPFGCAGIDLQKLNACVNSRPGTGVSQTSNALVACGAQQGATPIPGTDIPNAG
jgi:hypothetical protein